MFDDLEHFKNWWLKTREILPSYSAISGGGGVTSIVLFRQPPYQVELVTVRANFDIPDHIHPDVDSYEVYLAGDIFFRKNGVELLKKEEIFQTANGTCSRLGKEIRVLPTDLHGGFLGDNGGVFLSIQKWLKGDPGFIGYNWEGELSDEKHKENFINQVK